MTGTLVVIDMQNVFGDADSPWRTPRFDEVVGPIAHLVDAADRAVFTRFVAPERPEGSWVPYYEDWPFALQPEDAPAWDVVPELADRVDGLVSATTFSKWSKLRDIVPAGGTLVLCGVSTDCCVLSTALEAADAGMSVVVVGDACAGVDDDSHAKALDIMGLYAPLVRVVHSSDALALISS